MILCDNSFCVGGQVEGVTLLSIKLFRIRKFFLLAPFRTEFAYRGFTCAKLEFLHTPTITYAYCTPPIPTWLVAVCSMGWQ